MSKPTPTNNDGFKVFKNLLNKDEIEFYKQAIDEIFANRDNKNTFANGLVETEGLWGLIENPRMVDGAKSLLGDEVKFLQHNDVHRNFSASGWHRDCVDRVYGKGKEFENQQDYGILRVGVYLQGKESKFRLGLIKNSEKDHVNFVDGNNIVSKIFKSLDYRCPLFLYRLFLKTVNRNIELVELCEGDVIMFDPRVLHRATVTKKEKYSIFFSYGIENDHFSEFSDYYLKTRKDLKYSKISHKLKERLKSLNLLANYYSN